MQGQTALCIAAAIAGSQTGVVELLLSAGASPTAVGSQMSHFQHDHCMSSVLKSTADI